MLDEVSPQIFVSEREYLELKEENAKFKCEAGYWHAMHQKAINHEKNLKEEIEKQKGQIRDLQNRVFANKSKKENSGKMDEERLHHLSKPPDTS